MEVISKEKHGKMWLTVSVSRKLELYLFKVAKPLKI